MHVQALLKSLQKRRVPADMRHDAQLDLAVVRTGDDAARWCDEGFAHTTALGRTDGNVLQIRIIAGQAPGHRHRLRVMGVDAAGARQGQLRQLVGVGALELGEAPVFQNFGRQRKVFGQFFQHFLVGAGCAGGGFLDDWQTQLDKKYLANLFGAAEVKGLAREGMGLGLQFPNTRAQLLALCGQCRRIN